MDSVTRSHSVTKRDRNALFYSVTLYPLKRDSDRMTECDRKSGHGICDRIWKICDDPR
jgi:hypothetical protein